MARTKLIRTMIVLLTMTLSCSCVLGTQPAVAAPKWPIPDGVKTVEVNGYDMAYQEAGSGTPLLIVHGAWTDYRFFSPQVEDFSKNYRTMALSLRHCYPEKWDGVGDGFSVTQHALDVATLIKNLKLGKIHLIGHSRGGAVALTMAKLHPEVVRALILAEPSGLESLLPETPESKKFISNANALSDFVRESLKKGDIENTCQKFWDYIWGSRAWEKVSDEGKQRVRDNIGTATQKWERPKITCTDIQKFDFPVLLLMGERSAKRYGVIFEAMRQCKPDIPGPSIVPNAGHQIHFDNREFFKNVVLDFLNQH